MAIPFIDISGLPVADSTQFIGNIEDIVLRSSNDETAISVTVTVKSNYATLVTEVYVIPPFATATVRLKDILKHAFKFVPPCLMVDKQTLQNSSNVKDIDISIQSDANAVSSYFLLINNRLNIISTTEFLTDTFLTTQPTEKYVYQQDIECLTCYSGNAGRYLLCRASNGITSASIYYAQISGGLVDVVINFSRLKALFSSIPNITSYTFYYNEDSFAFTYKIKDGVPTEQDVFYFENSAGGFSMIRATGEYTNKNKYKSQIAEGNDARVDYFVDNESVTNVNSGYLSSNDEKYFFRDFLSSQNKYILYENRLRKIVVTEATADSLRKEISNFKFDYRYADNDLAIPPAFQVFAGNPGIDMQIYMYPQCISTNLHSSIASKFKKDMSYCSVNIADYELIVSNRLQPYINATISSVSATLTLSPTGASSPKYVRGFCIMRNKLTKDEISLMVVVIPELMDGVEDYGDSNPIIFHSGPGEGIFPFVSNLGGIYEFRSVDDYECEVELPYGIIEVVKYVNEIVLRKVGGYEREVTGNILFMGDTVVNGELRVPIIIKG